MTSYVLKSDLTKTILLQAKYFLELADEFFPFGTYINMEGEIIPLAASTGIEHPNSIDLINLLDDYMKKGLRENKIAAGAVGIDIYITPENSSLKREGIEIRFYFENDFTQTDRYFYNKQGGEYFFEGSA